MEALEAIAKRTSVRAYTDASPQVVALLEGCGRGCAEREGHIAGMAPLKEAAGACSTHAERYAFMCENFPFFDVEDAGDGIVIHFHKEACTCPMAPEVGSPILCHCTLGHEKAMWGEVFGISVEAEIVESFQRGGKDCVVKLCI